MYPWPSAYCYLGNERIKLLRVKPVEGAGKPGVIEEVTNESLLVGTGKGLVSIIELQPEGKKPMSVKAFLQGRKIKKGTLIT
jgi:methionyl-tRNA formyltransferase